MVIALFLQILIMILDRYLYKSKTFINVEEEKIRMKSRKSKNSKDSSEVIIKKLLQVKTAKIIKKRV
jgi:hypothetical protein